METTGQLNLTERRSKDFDNINSNNYSTGLLNTPMPALARLFNRAPSLSILSIHSIIHSFIWQIS
jgi:hypothetical protein